MKGVVFTEFLDMIDDKFGYETTETIIENSIGELSTGGAYTAIGTYPHSEIIALVVSLSNHTNIPVSQLVQVFGEHLLGQFAKNYRIFFDNVKDVFSFLKSIDNHIHVEVKKLYPDAELPRFECFHPDDAPNKLAMIYTSERAMSDLAAGLIDGTIKYYNESITYTHTIIEGSEGKKVLFELTKM